MEVNKKSGLTTLAEFDDLARYNNAAFNGSAFYFEKFVQVLNKTEEFRQKLVENGQQLKQKDEEIEKLKHQNMELEHRLAATRKAFTREACAKEAALKDFRELKQKLKLVQNLLNESHSHDQTKQVYTVLSQINLNAGHLSRTNFGIGLPSTFNEKEDGDESGDLLFDKSDDNLEPDTAEIENDITMIPKSRRENIFEKNIDSDSLDSLPGFPQTNFASNKLPSCANLTVFEPKKANIHESCPSMNIEEKRVLKRSDSQQNYLKNIYKKTMSGKNFKFESERLTTKSHEFSEKFCCSFVKCVVCNGQITLCSNYLICGQCRSVVHKGDKCKSSLPLPCVPKLTCSTVGLRKMITGDNAPEMIKIGDFTDSSVRPWVPGLLIHCCNEIDRRIEQAINTPSSQSVHLELLYQNRAPEREVRELKRKILEAKTGIPILNNEKVSVLCEVIKSFLRTLDDPVITKVLHADFLRVARVVEEELKESMNNKDCQSDYSSENEFDVLDSIQKLKSVILQLPMPNRDSLAFLFIHFKRVVEAKIVTKMDTEALTMVFGPILVRGSSSNTISHRLDLNDQLVVVGALMKISKIFWNGLLNDPNFNPFNDDVATTYKPTKRKAAGVHDVSFDYFDDKNDSFY